MRQAAVFLLLALAGACADAPTSTVGGVAATDTKVSVAQARQIEIVGKGIALALDDVEMRRLVIDAMRTSSKSRNRLSLQDFASGAGSPLITRAAARLGVTGSQLRAAIFALPALDLYLPLKRYRQAWKGTSEIMVGIATEKNAASLRLTGTDGREHVVRRGVRLPTAPFILLRPAEPGSPGIVSGTQASLDECTETSINCVVDDSSSYPVTAGIYIDHFNPQDDDGWWGDVEVEFYFTCIRGCGPSGSPAVFIRRDVEPFVGHEEDILVSAGSCNVSSPPPFKVEIDENDNGLNLGGDDWGTLNYPPRSYGVYEESWVDGDRKIYLRMICK